MNHLRLSKIPLGIWFSNILESGKGIKDQSKKKKILLLLYAICCDKGQIPEFDYAVSLWHIHDSLGPVKRLIDIFSIIFCFSYPMLHLKLIK